VYFDFEAPVGSTWIYEPPIDFEHPVWDIELESASDTLTVPAGHFSHCYRFGFTNIGPGWPKYAQLWVAPGVGLIKYWASNQVGFELTRYSLAE
jgi:hypothetical protein